MTTRPGLSYEGPGVGLSGTLRGKVLGLADGLADHQNSCLCLCWVCLWRWEGKRRNAMIHSGPEQQSAGPRRGPGATVLSSSCHLDPFSHETVHWSLDL